MSRIQILRSFVNGRLTAAAEDIFEVFERTIEEYEGEIDRLLDALKPAEIHRRDPPQLLVREVEVVPSEQCLFGGQKEPKLPQIKEAQEELWISQEGEQLQVL